MRFAYLLRVDANVVQAFTDTDTVARYGLYSGAARETSCCTPARDWAVCKRI